MTFISKFTKEEIIYSIVKDYHNGLNQRELATKYNCNYMTIAYI